jgi:hypothetical protein
MNGANPDLVSTAQFVCKGLVCPLGFMASV